MRTGLGTPIHWMVHKRCTKRKQTSVACISLHCVALACVKSMQLRGDRQAHQSGSGADRQLQCLMHALGVQPVCLLGPAWHTDHQMPDRCPVQN